MGFPKNLWTHQWYMLNMIHIYIYYILYIYYISYIYIIYIYDTSIAPLCSWPLQWWFSCHDSRPSKVCRASRISSSCALRRTSDPTSWRHDHGMFSHEEKGMFPEVCKRLPEGIYCTDCTMYVYIHIYIYIVNVCMYIHMCMYIHIYTYTYRYVCLYISIYVGIVFVDLPIKNAGSFQSFFVNVYQRVTIGWMGTNGWFHGWVR